MNWLDVIVAIAIILPVFMGFKNGIVGTVFTIAGLIVGIYLARVFSAPLAQFLGNFVHNATVQNVAAFVLVVVAALVVASVAARLVKILLKFLFLGLVDNVLGGVLGFVLGASTAVAIIQIVGLTAPEAVQASLVAPFLQTYWGPVIRIFMGNVGTWLHLGV